MDESVVVVTGTFDIFQPGNLAVLQQAGLLAKRVIVVVEPDEVAAAHCSKDRPQNKLETRVEMVSHLRQVDAVTRLLPEEVNDFFAEIKPFIWVTAKTQKKSEVYAGAILPAAEHVVELDAQDGCFTEEIIAAIAENRTPIKLPINPPLPLRGGDLAGLGHSLLDPLLGGAGVGSVQRPPISAPAVSVTVNGCFDILHIGHLRFLSEARAMGDSLTVLINSDVSVARYKGITRPIFPETFRAQALKALRCVDEVVVFLGDNPLADIERLRPQLHVKGGSYEPERVREERELVESWGGRLVCTSLVEGFSTSSFIRKALGAKDPILL